MMHGRRATVTTPTWDDGAGQIAPRFLDWLDAPAGLDWLEIGCGTGALSAAILARCDQRAVFLA